MDGCSSQIDIMDSQYSSIQILPPKHVYSDVVLFCWDAGKKQPFQQFPVSFFEEGEIREDWIKCQLVVQSRLRKMKPLKAFPGKVMSCFAKMEKGINRYY